MKKFIFQVEMQVADLWIEDGFDMHSKKAIDVMKEVIQQRLPYAHESEVKIKITPISLPDKDKVREMQGY